MLWFDLVPIPLCIEVIVIWLSVLSLLCRGDCYFGFVSCLLCRGGCRREELYTPNLVLVNPRWRFPVWEVLCRHIVKILLCEGGDVDQ